MFWIPETEFVSGYLQKKIDNLIFAYGIYHNLAPLKISYFIVRFLGLRISVKYRTNTVTVQHKNTDNREIQILPNTTGLLFFNMSNIIE